MQIYFYPAHFPSSCFVTVKVQLPVTSFAIESAPARQGKLSGVRRAILGLLCLLQWKLKKPEICCRYDGNMKEACQPASYTSLSFVLFYLAAPHNPAQSSCRGNKFKYSLKLSSKGTNTKILQETLKGMVRTANTLPDSDCCSIVP